MTTYALAPRVGWLDSTAPEKDTLYCAPLPAGPPISLTDSGRLIFLAVTRGGTLEAILDRVAEEAGVPREAIRDDVSAFVDQLVGLGLVRPLDEET